MSPAAKKSPSPPKHLRTETAAWWKDVHSRFVLESHHVRLLTLACEAWDRAAKRREAIAEHGTTYIDRFKARVCAPRSPSSATAACRSRDCCASWVSTPPKNRHVRTHSEPTGGSMPPRKRSTQRKPMPDLTELSQGQIHHLWFGDSTFGFDDVNVFTAAYRQHRQWLFWEFVGEQPGYRPFCWWLLTHKRKRRFSTPSSDRLPSPNNVPTRLATFIRGFSAVPVCRCIFSGEKPGLSRRAQAVAERRMEGEPRVRDRHRRICGARRMTRRGTPLPWSLRDEIRQRVQAGESRRSVARSLGIALNTCCKYSRGSLRQTYGTLLLRSDNQR